MLPLPPAAAASSETSVSATRRLRGPRTLDPGDEVADREHALVFVELERHAEVILDLHHEIELLDRVEGEIADQLGLGRERVVALEALAEQALQLFERAAHRAPRSGTRRGRSASASANPQCAASASSSTRIRTERSHAFSALNTSAVSHAPCSRGTAKPSITTAR